MMTTIETFIEVAKLAEQAERYDDMVSAMNGVVQMKGKGDELSREERDLLSVAYKNAVGARRASWKVVDMLITRKYGRDSEVAMDYWEEIATEIMEICKGMLALLEENLIPGCQQAESTIFYLKMKGDYYRYWAETSTDECDIKDYALEQSEKAYWIAFAAANYDLLPTDPTRLGLALNFSIFYYDVLHNQENAYNVAERAFCDAVEELGSLDEKSYKDSTLIIRILRDYMIEWAYGADDQNEENAEGDQENKN
ncbi:14-3-3-like protein [Corticium candelabrum]|uniref:14-3-3-like protein n=1 Tax=Corticium candelabrum TaxID=121492 RepID=UPI002E272FBE|nr:14-3-3-like protein [Corticium candelabrum]